MSSRKPTESALRTPAKNVQPSKTLASRKDPASDGNSPSPAPRSGPKFIPHSAAMKVSGSATTFTSTTALAVGTGSRKPTKAPDSAVPKPVLNLAKRTPARVGTESDKSASIASSTTTPQSKNGTAGTFPLNVRGLAVKVSSTASNHRAPLAAMTPVSKSGSDITVSTKADGIPSAHLPTSSSDMHADIQQPPSQIPNPVTIQPGEQSASHFDGQLTGLSASTMPGMPPLKVAGGRVSEVWKEKLTEEIVELMDHIQKNERLKDSLVVSRDAARQDLEHANKKIEALSLNVKELQEQNTKVSAENEQHKATIRALEVQVSTSEERARIADERLRNMTVKRYDTKAMMMAVEQKAKQEELELQVTRLKQKLQESTSNCDSWRAAAEIKSADYRKVQRELDEATLLLDEQKLTKEELDSQLKQIIENDEVLHVQMDK